MFSDPILRTKEQRRIIEYYIEFMRDVIGSTSVTKCLLKDCEDFDDPSLMALEKMVARYSNTKIDEVLGLSQLFIGKYHREVYKIKNGTETRILLSINVSNISNISDVDENVIFVNSFKNDMLDKIKSYDYDHYGCLNNSLMEHCGQLEIKQEKERKMIEHEELESIPIKASRKTTLREEL